MAHEEKPTITLGLDELKQLIMTAAVEFKKPTAEEAEKQEKQKAREKQNRDAMLEEIRQNEATRIATQASCSHKKPNGNWCTSGQPFSDGKIRIFCLACSKVWEVRMNAEAQRAVERGDISLAEMAPPQELVAA